MFSIPPSSAAAAIGNDDMRNDPIPTKLQHVQQALTAHPVTGANGLAEYTGQNISDPPTELLADGRERGLILFHDRLQKRLLLRVENGLGWRFHYGTLLDSDDSCNNNDNDSLPMHLFPPGLFSDRTKETNGAALELLHLRKAGKLFFTFQQEQQQAEKEQAPPMRVHVYEAL